VLDQIIEGQEIAYQLITLRQDIDQLEVQFSRLAKELDGTIYWAEDGSNSAIDWIRFNCHMTSNAAADRVAVGYRLNDLKESVQALDESEIGFAHLSVMTRTANAVGDAFDETKPAPAGAGELAGQVPLQVHALPARGQSQEVFRRAGRAR